MLLFLFLQNWIKCVFLSIEMHPCERLSVVVVRLQFSFHSLLDVSTNVTLFYNVSRNICNIPNNTQQSSSLLLINTKIYVTLFAVWLLQCLSPALNLGVNLCCFCRKKGFIPETAAQSVHA